MPTRRRKTAHRRNNLRKTKSRNLIKKFVGVNNTISGGTHDIIRNKIKSKFPFMEDREIRNIISTKNIHSLTYIGKLIRRTVLQSFKTQTNKYPLLKGTPMINDLIDIQVDEVAALINKKLNLPKNTEITAETVKQYNEAIQKEVDGKTPVVITPHPLGDKPQAVDFDDIELFPDYGDDE
jgi:hypothetical protein